VTAAPPLGAGALKVITQFVAPGVLIVDGAQDIDDTAGAAVSVRLAV